MKKTILMLLSSMVLVSACGQDTVAPQQDDALLDAAGDLSYAGSFVADPGPRKFPFIFRLPQELKLTAAQEAQIKSLVEQFVQSTKADHEALAAIMKQAAEAKAAGKSRDEIRAILEQGRPIRQRLEAAEKKLHDDVWAVLTAEQKAWLEAHRPQPCTAPPLSEEQRTQIATLKAAFAEAHKADLEAIKAAFEKARAARQNGATKEQVRAILEVVRPAMERVHAAEIKLAESIKALLTPEQQACVRGASPIPGPHKGSH